MIGCNKDVCKAIYGRTCALIRHSSRKKYAGKEEFVQALRYKGGGRGFDSRWYHYDFLLMPHCGPGVDSASNRNEFQEYIYWGKGG
jgi:hypothetical protein